MTDLWDAPNQQVVRPDESGPWQEGTGGATAPPAPTPPPGEDTEPDLDLDALTKAQLLELAQRLGLSPANNDMTKDELKQVILAGRG